MNTTTPLTISLRTGVDETEDRIVVDGNITDAAKITLRDVTIAAPDGQSALMSYSDLELSLEGENTLKAGAGTNTDKSFLENFTDYQDFNMAVFVPGRLTISAESAGSLTAIGGGRADSADENSYISSVGIFSRTSIFVNGGTVTGIGADDVTYS